MTHRYKMFSFHFFFDSPFFLSGRANEFFRVPNSSSHCSTNAHDRWFAKTPLRSMWPGVCSAEKEILQRSTLLRAAIMLVANKNQYRCCIYNHPIGGIVIKKSDTSSPCRPRATYRYSDRQGSESHIFSRRIKVFEAIKMIASSSYEGQY